MKDKIVNLMRSEGLSSSRLAEILEIQPSGVSHLISGRNKPGFDLLQKILRRFPNINPDWLLLDTGDMYRGDSSNVEAVPSPTAFEDNRPGTLFESPHSNREGSDLYNTNNHVSDVSQLLDGLTAGRSVNEAQDGKKGVRVERVIIFYSDRTFCSYEMR